MGRAKHFASFAWQIAVEKSNLFRFSLNLTSCPFVNNPYVFTSLLLLRIAFTLRSVYFVVAYYIRLKHFFSGIQKPFEIKVDFCTSQKTNRSNNTQSKAIYCTNYESISFVRSGRKMMGLAAVHLQRWLQLCFPLFVIPRNFLFPENLFQSKIFFFTLSHILSIFIIDFFGSSPNFNGFQIMMLYFQCSNWFSGMVISDNVYKPFRMCI